MEKAKTDTTYCTNKECENKCSEHESNYEFETDKLYCFHGGCYEYFKSKGGL